MHYDIIHELPGRLRIHCRNLRLDPDCRVELRRWVAQHREVVSATLSTRTGNILVVYTADATRGQILALLDDLHLFSVATITAENEASIAKLTEVAFDACVSQTVASVVKALLPKPFSSIKSGWRAGRVVLDMADKLSNRELLDLTYLAGKTILYALLGAFLPARFVLAVAFSIIEQVFPSLKPGKSKEQRQIATTTVIPVPVRAVI